jgi:hypothetical protein
LLRSGFSPKVLALRLSRMTAMPRLFCTLLLLLASLNCRAAEPAALALVSPEPAQLALLLYPESAQWRPIATLAAPSPARFEEIKWLLRKHYLEQLPAGAPEESADCSFITRALYEQNSTEHFYQADINADGAPDIIYSGSAQCREGALSLIWYGASNGWFSGQVSRSPSEILFIQLQPKAEFLDYMGGCCDDPISVYTTGERQHVTARDEVSTYLKLPSNMSPASGVQTAKGGVTLRDTPERIDQYEAGASERYVAAMFGNVTRRYLPGASLQLLQRYQDSQGVEWLLVRMQEGSDFLAVHSPFAVSIGWVEASCLQGPCSGPDFNSTGQ